LGGAIGDAGAVSEPMWTAVENTDFSKDFVQLGHGTLRGRAGNDPAAYEKYVDPPGSSWFTNHNPSSTSTHTWRAYQPWGGDATYVDNHLPWQNRTGADFFVGEIKWLMWIDPVEPYARNSNGTLIPSWSDDLRGKAGSDLEEARAFREARSFRSSIGVNSPYECARRCFGQEQGCQYFSVHVRRPEEQVEVVSRKIELWKHQLRDFPNIGFSVPGVLQELPRSTMSFQDSIPTPEKQIYNLTQYSTFESNREGTEWVVGNEIVPVSSVLADGAGFKIADPNTFTFGRDSSGFYNRYSNYMKKPTRTNMQSHPWNKAARWTFEGWKTHGHLEWAIFQDQTAPENSKGPKYGGLNFWSARDRCRELGATLGEVKSYATLDWLTQVFKTEQTPDAAWNNVKQDPENTPRQPRFAWVL
jgi:hypothetical protein